MVEKLNPTAPTRDRNQFRVAGYEFRVFSKLVWRIGFLRTQHSTTPKIQRLHERPAGIFVAAGELVIFAEHLGEPFGDGEDLVFAIGHGVEKSLSHLLPVVIGDPAVLRDVMVATTMA